MTSGVADTILVTGATGFVGTALVASLLSEQQNVCAVVRAATSKIPSAAGQLQMDDLSVLSDWTEKLDGIDCIVHLAARVHVMKETVANPLTAFRQVNVDGTLHLASQAAKAGVRRFIFLSSVKVNGEYSLPEHPFKESDIANPQDAYGLSKLEAEQGLLLIAQQTGMDVVIIRPPLVYGPQVKANFASMMRAVKLGLPLPLGAIHNSRSFVYVGNLVNLIATCIQHPAAANQVFLVSDGCDLSTTQLLNECTTAMGVRARLWPFPQRLIELFAALVGKRDVGQRLCGNLQVDIAKAGHLLGWAPPFTLKDGLKDTALAFLKKR